MKFSYLITYTITPEVLLFIFVIPVATGSARQWGGKFTSTALYWNYPPKYRGKSSSVTGSEIGQKHYMNRRGENI